MARTDSSPGPSTSAHVAQVNGRDARMRPGEERSLLWFLREELGLTGAKPGCGEGVCGACTVLLDGEPVRACVTPATAAIGCPVTTVEALADGDALHPVQAAFVAEGAVQCGYCTPGMVLAAVALLGRRPRPEPGEIREALDGHVCRCCAYPRIERAVARAAELAQRAEPPPPLEPAPGVATFWDFRPRAAWDLLTPDRREYFDLLGDGLVVALPPPDGPGPGPPAPRFGMSGAWLHVAPDGAVTAFTGKVEMGQDNRTALALIVADELAVAPASVRLAMGDTDLCPFDFGTFGSRSLPGAGEALRACAARARELLAADGRPRPGDRRLELVGLGVATLPPAAWRARGRPARRTTAGAQVRGAHRFPSDLALPGMLHGRVLRPPASGATLRSLDLTAAEAVPGAVVFREGDFVGAAAADGATAERAIDALAATWSPTDAPGERELAAHLRAHPLERFGWEAATARAEGDAAAAREAADVRLEATYTTAYLAHAALETRVAIARWDGDDRLTVWTGAQQPFAVRAALAEGLGLRDDRVRVLVPDIGGGFGGKHTEDEALAAARLARAAGAPVRVALTREQEFRHTYARPAAVIDVRSAARADGAITAWDVTNLNAGTAALEPPYRIPNLRFAFQPAASPLAQGPYRALAATANHFARESHVDELAAALGIDPLDLRLRHLADDRLADVLRAAAAAVGWGAAREPGVAAGIACGMEKGGRVATAAVVRVDGDSLQILRVVTAYECGALVNPDSVRRQAEGAAVMGLGGALFEALHFDAGRIENASFREYRVPRFTDVPPIDVLLLDRPELPPAGAGETPIVALAPALANAIVAATGPRLRSLPLLAAAPLRLVPPLSRPASVPAS
jgi:CO/xanthine dehydrogenase Mo-binding subunit/aerobic-type carbon monoxide dehydrogenase small subunit (CoxS/CutS family)